MVFAIMRKNLWKWLAGLLGSAVALCALFYAIVVISWDYEVEETRRAMLATSHTCPTGSIDSYERHGEVGWLRFCSNGKTREGRFAYWKKQRRRIEGTYVNGLETGKVIYFDEKGNITQVKEYPYERQQ